MERTATLDARALIGAMSAYREALYSHREALNRLNVYPVPDGDTGTNMYLTVDSVVTEIAAANGSAGGAGHGPGNGPGAGGAGGSGNGPGAGGASGSGNGPGAGSVAGHAPGSHGEGDMAVVCRAVSHGSLMGARGNSGVILSQILRGLSDSLKNVEAAGPDELARALSTASEAAYAAVMKPVEGTILTVVREAAEAAVGSAAGGADLEDLLDVTRDAAAEALRRTPEMLPVLADAGVVDAGGAGFVLFVDALLAVVAGRPLPDPPEEPDAASVAAGPLDISTHGEPDVGSAESSVSDLRYEVMYLLEAPDESVDAFKSVWSAIGDSIVVVGGDGLFNCHIHTDDIGAAVEAGVDVGRPRSIRVTDLAEQVDQRSQVEEERWVREATHVGHAEEHIPYQGPPVSCAAVAVANGPGIRRIFGSLGVQGIVHGGQSMNPSTQDILEAIEEAPSDEVVLLPNNPNIVPVANQAAELSGKKVEVIPTKGIPQGLAALLCYDPDASVEENLRAMGQASEKAVFGEVTRAVRDASSEIGPIVQGDWIGLSGRGIEVARQSLVDASCALLAHLVAEDAEVVTVIEGEGATGADTRRITVWLSDFRPKVEVEVHHGGQPLYPYLFGVD